jgi:SAM-dependent methyltransferase
VEDSAALVRFYDDAYSRAPAEAARAARWRALGAVGKADHVIALCTRAGLCDRGERVGGPSASGQSMGEHPFNTLEVGCGDGALLCELHRRGFGGVLSGVEITQAAVDIARQHVEIDSVELYDGLHLPAADGAYELGVLSHVLEHVHDPAELLAEVARACRAVVVEVPLEANWSARRGVKREHAAEVGHLQRLDRDAVRAFVARAGLSIAAELDDPLPLEVHRFFATSPRARAAGTLKWAARAGVHRLAPSLAHRAFTLHYACLCLPAGG